MFKFLFMLTIFLSFLNAKECYWVKDEQVCLKRYYDVNNLKKPHIGEKYYLNKRGEVFTFYDKIQLRLKYKGAILYILENFDVEFYDKKNYGTLILKVKDPQDILSIITNLNRLDAVSIARPHTIRKYKKNYVRPKYEIRAQEKEKRQKKGSDSGKLKGFSSQ